MDIGHLKPIVRSKAWARVAAIFGVMSFVYRPAGADAVMIAANQIATPLIALDITPAFTFEKPAKIGTSTFYAAVDGTPYRVGDYIEQAGIPYFFVSIDALAPPQVIRCSSTVSILRTQRSLVAGANELAAATSIQNRTMLRGWPAWIEQKGRGEQSSANLTGDVRNGQWQILLPASVPFSILHGDIITDDIGRDFLISTAELSPTGWRILALHEAL